MAIIPTIGALTIAGTTVATIIGNVIFGGLMVGLSVLLAPKQSLPSAASFDVHNTALQEIPKRMSTVGIDRQGGAYVCYEAHNGWNVDVIALHAGHIAGFIGWYVNDRPVELDEDGYVQALADGSFAGNNLRILTRRGLDTETAYDEVIEKLPDGVWTTAHRGDGIASFAVLAAPVDVNDIAKVYASRVPKVSPVIKGLDDIPDWRDDSAGWSDNPVLGLAYYLQDTTHGGLGLTGIMASTMDMWTAAADNCDEDVALKAGGTEKRYRCGFSWYHESAPADVIASFIASFDGWIMPAGDGSLYIEGGFWSEPDEEDIITDDDIIEYTIDRGRADEDRVTELVATYTSPDHAYKPVDTQPITLDGWDGKRRSQTIDLKAVPSNGQAQRLLKSRMDELGSQMSGTFLMELVGAKALKKRDRRVQFSELSSLADIYIKVTNIEFDLVAQTHTVSWVQTVGPARYAWTPALEEKDAPPVRAYVGDDDLPQPVITSALAEVIRSSTGGALVYLDITIEDTEQPDLVIVERHRVTDKGGGVPGPWSTVADMDVATAGGFTNFQTGGVLSNSAYDIQVAVRTAGGTRGPWSAIETGISTAVSDTAPGSPGLSASVASGTVTATITAPNSATSYSVRLFRATSGAGFGASSPVAPASLAAANVIVHVADSPGTGAWDYYAQAFSSSGAASSPTGPVTVSV